LPNAVCPAPGIRRPTVADLLARGGTIYLLARTIRWCPCRRCSPPSPDDLLDLAPPGTVAVLDDLAVGAVPTLPPGVVWTAPSRQRLATCYGEDTARAIVNGTAVLVYLGGAATKELTKLGVERPLRPGEALVVAGAGAPSIVTLRRVVAGKPGAELLADLERARARATASPETSWHARRIRPDRPSPPRTNAGCTRTPGGNDERDWRHGRARAGRSSATVWPRRGTGPTSSRATRTRRVSRRWRRSSAHARSIRAG